MVDKLINKVKWLNRAFFGIMLIPFVYFISPFLIPDTGTISDSVIIEDTLEVLNIVDGIDVDSGLIVDDNYELVKTNCSACHSLKLVTQNRATREGWKDIIVWMQETQKLWDLGDNEPLILDYLGKNYAPNEKGRRQNLKNIEWYEL
jgi:hypothetical protein